MTTPPDVQALAEAAERQYWDQVYTCIAANPFDEFGGLDALETKE
jgi:hypothetical protein